MKKKKEKISLERVAVLVDGLAEITKKGFEGLNSRFDKSRIQFPSATLLANNT